MSRDNDLPFARGGTLYDGDTTLIAADTAGQMNLEGKTFKTYDTQSGQEVVLMVVKNGGSTLTTPAGKGLVPKTDYTGRQVNGVVASAGGFGYLMDPAHVGDFVAGDYGYVLIQGFARDCVLGASNATSLGACVFNSTGNLIPVSTNDGHIVGRFAEAVTSTGDGNERVDVLVGGNAAQYND